MSRWLRYMYILLCFYYTASGTYCGGSEFKYVGAVAKNECSIVLEIQSWPKISAPLVNMIKGCENESALLILVIFYFKNSQKSNLSLDNKNFKWGEISL